MAPLDALDMTEKPARARAAEVEALNRAHGDLATREVIALAADTLFPGRIALVSSFGAESSVLLSLVAEHDPALPVVFIDTGRLFPETLEYRNTLIDRIGLKDVRSIGPKAERVAELDRHRALWMTNPDLCCQIRKTEPLAEAMTGFDAWFTGRKRFQSATRAGLSLFEADGNRIKINPLANWSAAELKAYAEEHDLPPHPLVADGYLSIGCVPCTDRVRPGEDARAGRWRGTEKDECGIHFGLEADGSGI